MSGMKPASKGTTKIDRAGLTDVEYIKALELSNETMADEIYRLRQIVLAYRNKMD